MRRKVDLARLVLIGLVVGLIVVPVVLAATSPFQRGREAVWVFGGLAGVLALGLLLAQPILVAGITRIAPCRRAHRWLGGVIIGLVFAHVAGLWFISPEDITDALLLRSPTPFSTWGVVGMSALLAAGMFSYFKRSFPLRIWKPIHLGTAIIGTLSAVIHAWLIFGAMEPVSKALLCLAIIASVTMTITSSYRLWRSIRKT